MELSGGLLQRFGRRHLIEGGCEVCDLSMARIFREWRTARWNSEVFVHWVVDKDDIPHNLGYRTVFLIVQ